MVRIVITLGSQLADRTALLCVTAADAGASRVAMSPTVAKGYRGDVAIACAGYPPRIPVRAVATSSSGRVRSVPDALSLAKKRRELAEEVVFDTVDRAPIGTAAAGLAVHVLPTLAN